MVYLCLSYLKWEHSTCRWTGNEDFQYGTSRCGEKYGREIVFSTLGYDGNYPKNNEKSGFEIIKNGISISGHLSEKILFLF